MDTKESVSSREPDDILGAWGYGGGGGWLWGKESDDRIMCGGRFSPSGSPSRKTENLPPPPHPAISVAWAISLGARSRLLVRDLLERVLCIISRSRLGKVLWGESEGGREKRERERERERERLESESKRERQGTWFPRLADDDSQRSQSKTSRADSPCRRCSTTLSAGTSQCKDSGSRARQSPCGNETRAERVRGKR